MPLLVLGLLLGLQVAVAQNGLAAEYGVCPKYTVKEGDILFDLAQKLGTSVEELTASANLCGIDATKMQIGQHLCLPGYDIARCDHVLETDPDRPYCQVYTVQLGDTTTSVAAKFGISEAELIALNSDYLDAGFTLPRAGQYVRLPGWNQVECRDFNDNDRPKCQIYTVESGDTANLIAQRYKVDVDEMLALNGLDPAAPLALNFKLKLPEWNATCPADGIPAVLPSDTVECRVTQLLSGDSLSALAARYKTTLAAIQAANPSLTDTTLQPGTYVNVAPFTADCIGQANLVDVPGGTTVPADYDYNGIGASAPTPGAAPPSLAPGPEPSAAPAPKPAEASPVPAPTPTPAAPAPAPTGAAAPAARASFLAAALALLAGAVLLL